MKKQFFAACFVLLSAACASEQTTESTAIILDEHNMTDHTGTDFDLSAQVLKWDFILLEQNDSCRLTDIARIRFADDDIFVVNIEGVRSDLYRYDAEGRFLNRIARQDRDYGFINNVWIDKSRQRVYLPDLADRALRIYRYDGDSVSRYERYPDIEFIADAVVDDNGILGYFGITPKRRTAFFKADSILRNSVRLSASRTTSGYSGVINFSQHAISTYAGRTLFIQPFCDTLYVYAEGRITPAYVTRTGASLPPEFDFPADADCTTLKQELEERGYYSKTGIFETSTHLWIGCGPNRMLFDKRTSQGICFQDRIVYHPDIFPPLDFIGCSGGRLAVLCRYREIEALRAGMAAQEIAPAGKLEKLFEQVSPGDWAVLFYTFK